MANSNTTYKQQMEQNNNNNNHANAVGAVTNANKKKNINPKTQQKQRKEMSSSSASSTSSSSSSSSSSKSSRKNVITSQCDSSSSKSDNINVKHENNQSCDTIIKTELESADQSNETALTDANDFQLSSMRQRPILLSTVNPHIICGLCFGYLIDATTIVECLHSFCHSCLIKHLRTEQYCPRCEMMINTAKPNIKPDTTLQAIVYKLVPGLYERELMRKRAFYKDRAEEAAVATPEQRGDDTEHLIFSPSDYMSISLEYADIDELIKSNAEYNELLKPRYLQCPAMCTVGHLKKLVYGKFDINSNRFTIDIMYKVKTIVLLDHYTLMDVAYIYTWKRDAPMRFYFRVKQSLKPLIRVKKNLIPEPKKEVTPTPVEKAKLHSQAMVIVHEPTPSIVLAPTNDTCSTILEPEEIKQENEAEVSSTTEIATATLPEPKQFEIVQPQSPSVNSHETSLTDKLKITLVNKAVKDKSSHGDVNPPARVKSVKEKKDSHKTSPATSTPKDERKVENIKLKIDLSKQNSVTIINMSDPERKEIVKPVKPEKEWKVKTKKDKDGSPKSSPKSSPHSERKSKTPSPLTVPPLTIKAVAPLTIKPSLENAEDDKKSQFLKSFSLAPINSIKAERLESKSSKSSPKEFTHSIVNKSIIKDLSLTSSSKRKSKEPIKAVVKKPKLSPPLATEDFKIKLPHIPSPKHVAPPSNAVHKSSSNKPLMPPPAPLSAMRPPAALNKKSHKPQQSKITAAPPGSLTPHPMHGGHDGIQLAAPGSRTPIAKRFQPILPKASRVNPFANIPSDVNKILKDAGTEIKSIPNEPVISKVYGPKIDTPPIMGPPSLPTASKAQNTQSTASNSRNNINSSSKSGASSKNNSYLNLALFNASKSKGNEVPPGCRTPMYTPNSPIYSPSSPQYVPNYNIPTMPTYKYTPKPNNSNNSYLQSVLGSSNQMASLFPSPPVKKDSNTSTNNNNSNLTTSTNNTSSNSTHNRNEHQAAKRVYVRSPSPIEDPPEKQLKVKSLLNSCNINIPSSLSITITREDGESSCNGQTYPKHKSPVNNYIEILKLPDQPAENAENKRLSPPMQTNNNNNSLFPNPPVKRVATPPLNSGKSVNNHSKQQPNNINNNQKSQIASAQNATNLKTALNNMGGNSNMMPKINSNGANKSPVFNNKPQPTNKSAINAIDKKTPSPEKRLHSSTSEQKSPKSPNGDSSASKKFRHILPRQISNPLPEVNIPKPQNNGNIIGTYSSPNGVNVKIHSNKKAQPSKNSPGAHASIGNNKQLPQNPVQSHNGMKPSTKSSQTSKVNNKTNQPQAINTNNPANKMAPTTPNLPALPPGLTHPMQAMLPPHLGVAAAAACQNAGGQAELSKFLKENLLRAQVQAAVANQSNMFYPNAANAAAAAQLGQFYPSMYNYQQAYIMDQLSRMQRAGNEALSEYMQKIKNSMEANKSPADLTQQTKQMQSAKNLSSTKSITATNNNPTSSSSSSATPPTTAANTHPIMKDQPTAKTK